MGIIAEASGLLDPAALGPVAGPCVHLKHHDPSSAAWQATVLVACKASALGNGGRSASLAYRVGDGQEQLVRPLTLLKFRDWTVIRFPLDVATGPTELRVTYRISLACSPNVDLTGRIAVPATTQNWNVAAYSCNDQRQHPAVGTAAWMHMRALHAKSPLHLLLGTGDQLYNDNVWGGEKMEAWLDMRDKAAQRATALSEEQVEEVEEFYFFAYLRWLRYHPLGKDLGSIAQKNTWDDHDIFDGFGSYPDSLQECDAFQQIFQIAKRMYMAFQLHTTEALKAEDNFFWGSDHGLSWLTQLGPDLAVAALDTRTGRSREQIVAADQVDELFRKIGKLPPGVSHLLVVSAVPMLYPEMSALESFLSHVTKRSWLLKTGVYNNLMNEFGEPELLDDIVDHWSSSRHKTEKARMLGQLRELAAQQRMRISLLSGDVHQCGLMHAAGSEDAEALAQDPGYIPQLIASAIAYKIPPSALVRVLEQMAGRKGKRIDVPQGDPMYEIAGRLFKARETRPGTGQCFANRNNFLQIRIAPLADVIDPGASNGAEVPARKEAAAGSSARTSMAMLCTWHVRLGSVAAPERATDGRPDSSGGSSKAADQSLREFACTIPPLLGSTQEDSAVSAKVQDHLEHLLPSKHPRWFGTIRSLWST